MITIKDVAEKAGVSKTTVSRIVNNQGNFSAATIAKVRQVIVLNLFYTLDKKYPKIKEELEQRRAA